MSEYTKGEWEIGICHSKTNATPIRVKSPNGSTTNIAWVCGLDADKDFPLKETEANARLIAAAPKLLEACKEAYEALLIDREMLRGELADAIAEAEGE